MEYQKDEHRVHLIVYHLVWCPKRRKSVLCNEIAEECETLIKEKCREKGWEVLCLSISPDHVHLFIRCFPSTSAAEVVKECKGTTSRNLKGKFPELMRLPSLWTRSYFASTASNVSQEIIKEYIQAQKGK